MSLQDEDELRKILQKGLNATEEELKAAGADKESINLAWKTFQKNKKRLLKEHPEGGFVAIFRDDLIGIFETEEEAIKQGEAKYPGKYIAINDLIYE